jgi:uncharacterized membrane protein
VVDHDELHRSFLGGEFQAELFLKRVHECIGVCLAALLIMRAAVTLAANCGNPSFVFLHPLAGLWLGVGICESAITGIVVDNRVQNLEEFPLSKCPLASSVLTAV